jgi:NADP-dependent 3-hydroxy acid dehydrogenase YdfG
MTWMLRSERRVQRIVESGIHPSTRALVLVEPGAVATELATHVREEVRASMMQRFADVERMEVDDIADAITFIVTRPRRLAIKELLIRPTEQEG